MLLALLYFAFGRFLRLLALGTDRDGAAREIEILVLRHQLRVLSRGRRLQLLRRVGSCLPRQAGSCRVNGGGHCLYPRIPWFAGTVSSSGGNGPTEVGGGRVDRGSRRRWQRSFFDWPRRTPAGAICASRASYGRWACPYRPPPSACCFAITASRLLRESMVLPGGSS